MQRRVIHRRRPRRGAVRSAGACRRHHRRGRDLPYPDLRQVGGRLQEVDRHRHELPVDRLGRRHQADHRQDGRLRRLRRAAEARGPGEERPDPVPADHGRRGAGLQHQGHRGRQARSSPASCSPTSISARSRSGTTRRSRGSTPASSCPTRRSRWCTARTARAPRSCSPTIFRRSAPSWKSHGRRGHGGASGRSASAARATRASPTTSARIDGAIGYVEYAYAKQNKLAYAQMLEPGRQVRRAGRRRVQGGRGGRRLGEGARACT